MQIPLISLKEASQRGGGAVQISEQDYHRDPCPSPSLSSSIGKLLLNATPHHAFNAHPQLKPDWKPEPGSNRTAKGSGCHEMLLGRGAGIVRVPFDNYRTKEAQRIRDEAYASGQTPLTTAQHDNAEAIVAAAYQQLSHFNDPALHGLAEGDGKAEVMVMHEDLGGWMRILIDWWSEDPHTLIDYKTTEGLASYSAFSRRAAQMDYDFQAAFYLFVVGASFPELVGRLRFLFVVQEVDPPYALAVHELSEADMTIAGRKVQRAMQIWFDCLSSGKWPSYPAWIQRTTLPSYHSREWLDREMEEGAE